MSVNNPWLNPFQRSYGQIKSSVISKIKSSIPEITDFSDSNIFMILVGIFSAIAEVLHYYIDNMGREAFFSTSRRYSSLLKHAKLVDYRVKSANPASVDITVSLNGYASYSGTPTGCVSAIVLTADNTGTDGDTITITGNGSSTINDLVTSWNNSNTSNTLTITSGDDTQIISANISIMLSGSSVLNSDFSIPIGSIFKDENSKEFISTKTVNWQSSTYGVSVPCIQKTLKDNISFGTITDSNSIITLGDLGDQFYAEGSMNLISTLNSNETPWELVDTFAYSKQDSHHYQVLLDDNQDPYIKFGDGQYGMKPTVGSVFSGSYYITYGGDGNVDQGTITVVPTTLSQINAVSTNPYPASSGSNYESFNMIKDHLPLSVKTLGVAISTSDYEDVVKLIPGVDKAYVDYICGKQLIIYITPDGGGIASTALLDEVLLQVTKKKVITTSLDIESTSEARIVIDANITGRKSFKTTDINNQVKNALKTNYSYETSDIAKPVRLSDLYSIIDQLSMVDYLTITNLYLIPTPIAIGSTTSQLNFIARITKITLPDDSTEITYILQVILKSDGTKVISLNTSTNIELGVYLPIGTVNLTTITLDSCEWEIAIREPSVGVYSVGESWTLNLLKNNVDQTPSGYAIPVFQEKSTDVLSTINLTITEVV